MSDPERPPSKLRTQDEDTARTRARATQKNPQETTEDTAGHKPRTQAEDTAQTKARATQRRTQDTS